jgi:hypothetical protein
MCLVLVTVPQTYCHNRLSNPFLLIPRLLLLKQSRLLLLLSLLLATDRDVIWSTKVRLHHRTSSNLLLTLRRSRSSKRNPLHPHYKLCSYIGHDEPALSYISNSLQILTPFRLSNTRPSSKKTQSITSSC